MGEVYRDRDTKLNRDVAIKVCPRPSRTMCSSSPSLMVVLNWQGRTLAQPGITVGAAVAPQV
jgi:hypothetical protein